MVGGLCVHLFSQPLMNSVASLLFWLVACVLLLLNPRLFYLLCCKLIALAKNPSVCPFGVGEIVRCIIVKAVLSIIGPDIQQAAGPLQLCVRQSSGIEAGYIP